MESVVQTDMVRLSNIDTTGGTGWTIDFVSGIIVFSWVKHTDASNQNCLSLACLIESIACFVGATYT